MKTIYTLELEHGKYYVGLAKNSEKRILQHFENNGSQWTKIHKPIRVLREIKGDEWDEEKHTLLAMDEFGIDNVRGGSYCQVNLTENDKNKALQTIRSVTSKCFKCGSRSHFANRCDGNGRTLPDPECDACSGTGISYWSDDVWGACMLCSFDKIDVIYCNKYLPVDQFKNFVKKNIHNLPNNFVTKILG
jgi:hypothetical protein